MTMDAQIVGGETKRARSASTKENRQILKTVIAAIVVALLWKFNYYLRLDYWNRTLPIQDEFFPWFFRNQAVARFVYLSACGAGGLALFLSSRIGLVSASVLVLATMVVLNVHQSGFNDVTFLCCGWASVWCVWMAWRIEEPVGSLHPRAAWLSHVILSLIFLGGATGKLTDEFLSGQVLYELYFRDHDYWFYNLIRNSCSAESVRSIATWHSRAVFASEFICGFFWLMPMRFASWLALVMLMGIALTNNVLLFSVVTSLLGLAIVGLHQSKVDVLPSDDQSPDHD